MSANAKDRNDLNVHTAAHDEAESRDADTPSTRTRDDRHDTPGRADSKGETAYDLLLVFKTTIKKPCL